MAVQLVYPGVHSSGYVTLALDEKPTSTRDTPPRPYIALQQRGRARKLRHPPNLAITARPKRKQAFLSHRRTVFEDIGGSHSQLPTCTSARTGAEETERKRLAVAVMMVFPQPEPCSISQGYGLAFVR